MRRNPALTFSGALKILDKYESKTIRRLDKALGGIILAAGAGAGIAAVGGAALAPAALAAAAWGWVDQKNEAMGLLRGLTGRLSPLVRQTKGLERRQLIAAAHSVIVVSAFLEVLEKDAGKDVSADLTENDRQHIIAGGRGTTVQSFVEYLYTGEIPTPSASAGFAENRVRVIDWGIRRYIRFRTSRELGVLDTELAALFGEHVGERYESNFVRLAASAPEFAIWMMHTEHAATRQWTAQVGEAVRQAFAIQGEALTRVETVLAHLAAIAGDRPAVGRNHDGLHKANIAVLDEPIVSRDAERYGTAVTFPAVREAFRTPRYQINTTGRDVMPASETWWESLPVRNDLDAMIASYLTSPAATQLPLLLLGHPGAGKSLLTKVLAARLPVADYTVVRVPLRKVGASAPIVDQIREALTKATNGHVDWHALVDEPSDGVLVVLLDGLDELLQATSVDRRGYLQEVMEFQRIEGELNRPVAVVVTSRTVVADRVDVPDGTTIVKLVEFDDHQVKTWLGTWRAANQTGIDAGTVGELALSEVHHQIALARQPLLLLMLALYAADPDSAKLDAGLSTSALYERIFDNFARREVQKRAQNALHGTALEDAVADQIVRLSVAALAMFNRGVQHVNEAELREDLKALRHATVAEHEGRRLLGEFFFVHAAEGVTAETERSYEFLHATFGEYLVAQHVLTELVDVAAAAYAGRRSRDPDDKMLFALLSHQVWATRRNIVDLAAEIFAALPEADQTGVRSLLIGLIGDYRQRPRSAALDGYRPTLMDIIGQPAAYSANLVTLAVAFAKEDGGLGLVGPFGDTEDQAMTGWRSTVTLWRAGLDEDSWLSVLFSFDLRANLVVTGTDAFVSAGNTPQVWFARLSGDVGDARRAGFGEAILGGTWFVGDDWTDRVLSRVYPEILRDEFLLPRLEQAPYGTPHEEIAAVVHALVLLLRVRAASLPTRSVENIVHWLTRDPNTSLPVSIILLVVYHHPHVLLTTHRWQHADLYVGMEGELRFVLSQAARRVPSAEQKDWRRVRRRLLGGEASEQTKAGSAELTASLIDLLTIAPASASYPIRRGGPGPGRR